VVGALSAFGFFLMMENQRAGGAATLVEFVNESNI
jgi:hypothetical protein